MNKLIIPSSPNWYESRILACAIDNTLVYGTRNEVVLINPTREDEEGDIKILPRAHLGRIISVDVNQNWAPGNKLIVSAGDDKVLHLWNAESYSLMMSNNTHTIHTDKLVGSVFLAPDKIVSVSEQGFVSLWRFNSNETTTFKNLFVSKVRISTISACPHLTWMVAFGLHSGLIIIADLRKSGRIVYRLRGHEKSIISLAWCPTPYNIFPKKLKQQPKSSVTSEESIDDTSEKSTDNLTCTTEKIEQSSEGTTTVALDETLSSESGITDTVTEAVTSTQAQDASITDQLTIPAINVIPPSDNDSSINISFVEILETEDVEAEKSEENNRNDSEKSKESKLEEEKYDTLNKEYLLASSSRKGTTICIWRVGTDGRKETELYLGGINKNRRWRSADRSPWIALCWVSPDVLLSSSPSAELLQWNLITSGHKPQRKLVHHDHNKNLFAIVAPMAILPEWNNEIRRQQSFFAWTTGQERYILNTSLQMDRTLRASYPTLGGNVHAMSSSPLDPSRLALGIGDGTARIWDLSRPHKQCVTMVNLWQKIQSKVLALAWHPQKETILAYATDEGRVGTVNMSSKTPTLLSQYFRNAVYDIQWGPLDDTEENLGLYAVGEGKVVLYNPLKETEDPKIIESPPKEHIHCIAWKTDFSLLVCGTKCASIIIYDKCLNLLKTIYSEYKSIYRVVWHPLATAQDEGISEMESWIAISSSSTSAVVFDVNVVKKDEDETKKIAVLHRHTRPIQCVSWSPYVSGRLVTGGDDGVIFVWDVPKQTVLSTFVEHYLNSVLTVLWSPLDENFVISAGKDNCIRVWNFKEHCAKSDEEIAKLQKPYISYYNELKKLTKEANENTKEDELRKVNRNQMLPLTSKAQNSLNQVLKDCFRMLNPEEHSVIEENSNLENDFDVLKLFGDKNSLMELLTAEQKSHLDKKKTYCHQNIDLWKGNIAEMVKNSIAQGTVTPWLISVAAMVSPTLGKEACEIYAKKLVEDAKSDPIETVSYLLICHKVEEAIQVLCNATLFREALVLAKSRFCENDPIINEILKKWAIYGIVTGIYETSAQCFMALGQYEEAAKALFRRENVDTLKLALALAEKSGNKELVQVCEQRHRNFKLQSEEKQNEKSDANEEEPVKVEEGAHANEDLAKLKEVQITETPLNDENSVPTAV